MAAAEPLQSTTTSSTFVVVVLFFLLHLITNTVPTATTFLSPSVFPPHQKKLHHHHHHWGNLPDALIIGAKKCGTRALLEFLRVNPRVRAGGPEVHFFDKHFARGVPWYRKMMPVKAAEGEVVLEKSPHYFVDPKVPARVKRVLPRAKLILIVRDPVTRAVSDYTQALAIRKKRNIYEHRLGELIACGKNTSDSDGEDCVRGVNSSHPLVSIGRYQKHLENWLKHFPLRQMMVVDGERFIRSPAPVLREVEQFLGLIPVIRDEHFVWSPEKGFFCVAPSPYLPLSSNQFNSSQGHPQSPLQCLGRSKGRRHVPVPASTLAALHRFYAPENERLFRTINRRFQWKN